MPIYDTDIEDVIKEEEGFGGKEGFGGEEDNIEYVVVVANDLSSSRIQTTLSVDFSKTVDSNPHELIWLQKNTRQRSDIAPVVHRNALPNNVLLDNNVMLWLLDFRSAKMLNEEPSKWTGVA
ncbi:reverse transcriptase domain-containing protein, partial [Tanacetum coccineum]